MQLGKRLPKHIMTYTIFPLTLSIICYSLEDLASLFNSDVSAPQGHLSNQSLASLKPLLEDIRGPMMDSYHSYFRFMGMMLILHIVRALIQFAQEHLKEESPMALSQTQQQDQETPLKNSKKYSLKVLQCLFYFTLSYYLCQFVVGTLNSPRSTFVGAKDIPNQFPPRILEEFQGGEISNYSEKSNFGDRLTSIVKLKGAVATVVSKDGNKIFQISEIEKEKRFFPENHILSGMDISDPLAIKYYPELEITSRLGSCPKSLELSSDTNILFVIDCEQLTIYNRSDTRYPPRWISSTSLGWYSPVDSSRELSVALYEEENAIIILNDNMQIVNISDLNNPRRVEINLGLNPGPIAFIPQQRKALVGGRKGLLVIDISNLQNPVILKTILKSEFVISITLSADKSMAFVGVLNRTFAQNQKIDVRNSWKGSLLIYSIDLDTLEPLNSIPIDQLKTCRGEKFSALDYIPDVKMASNSEYAYWVCDKDFGYVEMATGKVSRFLAPKSINTIELAQNDRILLKADSDQTNLYALYQNIPRNDPFIWKPTSLSRLKFNSSSQTLLTSKKNRRVFIINESTLQVYDTSKNIFSLLSTIQLEIKPTLAVPSNDGKRLYMKTDEKTIQILDLSNPKNPHSVSFPQAFDDYFIVSPDDQIIFASRKIDSRNTAFFAANISDLSKPEIDYLRDEDETIKRRKFSKLFISDDSKTLIIFDNFDVKFPKVDVTNLKQTRIKDYIEHIHPQGIANYLCPSPISDIVYVVATRDDIGQKEIQFIDPSALTFAPNFPIPYLSGNLHPQISSDGKFLYVSTPDHLMEINVTNYTSPKVSRLMKLSINQFSFIEDSNLMYAVIGDYLKILDLKPKYSLASFKENVLLGTQSLIDLQLLSRNSQNKYSPIYTKHKYLTANFYEASISAGENEPIVSYSVLPSWINFDKDHGRVSFEPKDSSLLGSHRIYTTGSFQVPSSAELASSLSFLNNIKDSENLIADLTDRGYLDEDRFLTIKFNAYKKLTLDNQYAPFESDIRYFLRSYSTDQEFDFQVTSSLFLYKSPQRIWIETQSLHQVAVKIKLFEKGQITYHETAQILQQTFSVSRSDLNKNQTRLTLQGSLSNINKAFQKIVIDLKDNISSIETLISVSDGLNPPVDILIDDAWQYFRINKKPIANPNLPIQTQVDKFSLVSGQSFSINIDPESYSDINQMPLKYTLDTKLDWLALSGFILSGTPSRKLWPSQVDVTLRISNEFKSEKVTFSLYVGISAVIVLQYVVLYFGYAFSAYKAYKNFPKIYNILAQRFYRYEKVYQVSVDQEVTDATITPIGFFGKEFENANLLMKYLKNHLSKDLIDYFKDEQRHGLFDKNKLIATIKQTLESLTFEEKHSVKYYIQVNDDQKDIIHRIILDQIILSEISLEPEKQTYNIFKNIKDQWINIVEQDTTSQPYFKVNRSKLNYVLQNLNSKTKPSRSSEYPKNHQTDEFLDITNSLMRPRNMSDSHLFEKSVNDVEESFLKSSLNDKLENVNIDLLELALQAHAFKSHHLNAQREQVTIISNERKVGSSCVYKIKALFRKHLQKLQFTHKEELGYGLKYVFQKDVMHFCGTPEPKMEYETLVVQILNKSEMIIREIYIFGAENKNRKSEYMEQVQEQL